MENSIQAERFIPQHKKLQWECIPNIILIPPPSFLQSNTTYTGINSNDLQPNQASKQSVNFDSKKTNSKQLVIVLRQWIHSAHQRKSHLDTCALNILHHLDYCEKYMNKCLRDNLCVVLIPDIVLHRDVYLAVQHVIQQHIKHVKHIESALDDMASNKTASSIPIQQPFSINSRLSKLKEIMMVYDSHSSAAFTYDENRIIQTTPEKLAQICDAAEYAVDMSLNMDGVTFGLDQLMQMDNCLGRVCQDYLSKMNMVMDVERLQSMEDVKCFDMYSCKFDSIEIPAPKLPYRKCPGCIRFPDISDSRLQSQRDLSYDAPCAYHQNLMCASDYKGRESFVKLEKSQGSAKASMVRTSGQFSLLSQNLMWLSQNAPRTDKRVIAYLTVTGVAENRPLVCMGDFVRLRFGRNEEVLAEVGAVTMKTESVMLILPIDDWQQCPQYFAALCHPKNRPVIQEDVDAFNGENDSNCDGRFDVRFGIFGARAHEIFKAASMVATQQRMDHVVRVLAPSHLLDGVRKKSSRSISRNTRVEMINDWVSDVNWEQKKAVEDIVWKRHGQAPYCIYGPPGTGKTMTVVESIVQVLRCHPNSRILVCAPSDAACDVVAIRLRSTLPSHIQMLRVNWWARNPASLPPSLLSCSTIDHEGCFTMPSKEVLLKADVIVCQCFVAGILDIDEVLDTKNHQESWMVRQFTHVFMDESSQSFEFESLIPLFKVGKSCSIILAGDPRQLGPMARSRCAGENGLFLSLQERLMKLPLYKDTSSFCTVMKLVDNYRSHDALLRVPSELFYEGNLRCKAPSSITSVCKDFELLRNGEHFPLMAYDVCHGVEKSKLDTPSYFNMEECHAVVKIIKALLSSTNVNLHAGQIAVITCFRAQVLHMRNLLREEGLPSINVGVVEDFQGQETSVVLISTVLTKEHDRWKSGAKSGLGFMTDPKKFNVAITRASALCVIVGKVEFLQRHGLYWSALIEHIRKNGGLSSSDSSKNDHEVEHEVLIDYGIEDLLARIESMSLLGAGYEMDRYELAIRGYYQESPEWRVCL